MIPQEGTDDKGGTDDKFGNKADEVREDKWLSLVLLSPYALKAMTRISQGDSPCP